VLGPLGSRIELGAGVRGVALIGRGAGVAPMVKIAQDCARLGIPVYSLLSAWEDALLLGTEDLRRLSTELVTVTNRQGSDAETLPAEVTGRWAREGLVDVI